MISTTIFPGRYIQGPGAIMRLGQQIARFGNTGFVICSPNAFDNIIPAVRRQLGDQPRLVAERFGRESSEEEMGRLAALAQKAGSDVVVGVGGGKTLDTAKAVGSYLRLHTVIAPTIASTDAPCSSVAVVYTPSGEFVRYLFLPRNPDTVLVDTAIIAQAPVRFLVSGMGDALATWFEAESCREKRAPNATGDVGSLTGYALARLCYDTLLQYGALAKSACEVDAVTPALEHIVEANTLLSGLGFESGGLAAAHAIHNGLTALEGAHRCFHGEKVAFGTLASLFMTDQSRATMDEVYGFCESIGLPTTFADVGIPGVTDEELQRVCLAACEVGESIHNEPGPMSPETVLYGLKCADAEGRRRKA